MGSINWRSEIEVALKIESRSSLELKNYLSKNLGLSHSSIEISPGRSGDEVLALICCNTSLLTLLHYDRNKMSRTLLRGTKFVNIEIENSKIHEW